MRAVSCVRIISACALLLCLVGSTWADAPRRFGRKGPIPVRPRPAEPAFPPRDAAKEELGRLLFFDKLLSGNRNISCATCHHPLTHSGDALSLPIGEGGQGLGPARNVSGGVPERVPRNSPALFNLGAAEFDVMFHDGRAEIAPDQPHGFRSPAGDRLPAGLDSLLAVQAMFPVTSGTEMAGQPGENEIADAAATEDFVQIWELLAGRLRANESYVARFIASFDEINTAQDITYVHAANAIAAFEAAAFRADDSPFDRYLRGDRRAMSARAVRGMNLFYGKANCVSCHSGRFQTNHEFRAIGFPQIGPGKGDNVDGFSDGLDDFGRERVTGDPSDRFRFRVPTLRNVALTGPWGHTGAFDDLGDVIRHHLDPQKSLEGYDTTQAVLPIDSHFALEDFAAHRNGTRRAAIAQSIEITPSKLSEREVGEILEFLHALTDPAASELRTVVPLEVPSGLPVAD